MSDRPASHDPQQPAGWPPEPAGSAPDSAPEKPRLAFESLSRGNSEVLIEFRGQLYRLRATRNGKLILNK